MSEHVTWLEADVGTWDGEMEVRPGPGAAPQHSRGVMTQRMIGGWLVSDFVNETGFEGRGIYGWDSARGTYVGTWIDSMRGSLVVGTGTREGETLTYRFEMGTMRWADVTTRIDANTRRFESLIEAPNGEMFAVVVATYRRRQ